MGCYTYLLSSGTVPLAFFEHFYKTKKGKNTCRSLILRFNRQSGIPVWNVKLLMSTCRTKLNFQIFYLFIYLSGLKVILVPVIFLVKALWWKDFEALFINLILKEHSFEVKKKRQTKLFIFHCSLDFHIWNEHGASKGTKGKQQLQLPAIS